MEDGENELEGRLEVYKDGEWGTVCHQGFGMNDAVAVCRQLGYYGLNPTFQRGAAYGEGTGPVHMTSLRCNIHSQSLADCNSTVPDPAVCTHRKDVGVACVEAESTYIMYSII